MEQDRTSNEADQLLTQLGEYNPDVIWMFSPDWRELKFVNQAYEDVWGRSIQKLIDDPSDFLRGIHPADREKVKEGMDRLSDEEPVEIEYRVNPDEDYQRHVWVSGRPIYSERAGFIAVAGFARDITQRKQYEQELERKTERLENFAAVVSHDLRNPLNVAQGRLELAQSECDSEHLDAVATAHARMNELIDDILTLARTGDSVDEVETVRLAEMVERCWRNVPTADATRVIESDQLIRADSDRLRQLFENLIRNAVEHGGEDVTVRVGNLTDGFYIEDDGPGISTDERKQVFETGYSTAPEGTGFGLNIVAEIVDAHGWDVSVTESKDRGARVEITGIEYSDS